MNKNIHEWVNTGLIVLVGLLVLVGGNQSGNLGATGTRMPNGLSTNSTSPVVGELRTTTLTVTGASSQAAGTFSGAIIGQSTLAITATSTLTGNVNIGTTTPAALVSGGFISFGDGASQGTTTLYMGSIHGTRGGCLQLEGPASTTFRLYATSSAAAVWESGTCQ